MLKTVWVIRRVNPVKPMVSSFPYCFGFITAVTLTSTDTTCIEPVAPNPLGVRDAEGNIVPLPEAPKSKDVPDASLGDTHYVGAKIDVPKRVGDLVC